MSHRHPEDEITLLLLFYTVHDGMIFRNERGPRRERGRERKRSLPKNDEKPSSVSPRKHCARILDAIQKQNENVSSARRRR